MSKYYESKDLKTPSAKELEDKRKELHSDHLDYFYGDHWNIFIDKASKCFLQFDVGHFTSEFIVREISHSDYKSLKKDESLFTQVSRKVR